MNKFLNKKIQYLCFCIYLICIFYILQETGTWNWGQLAMAPPEKPRALKFYSYIGSGMQSYEPYINPIEFQSISLYFIAAIFRIYKCSSIFLHLGWHGCYIDQRCTQAGRAPEISQSCCLEGKVEAKVRQEYQSNVSHSIYSGSIMLIYNIEK